jgi:hypothetical protein
VREIILHVMTETAVHAGLVCARHNELVASLDLDTPSRGDGARGR